MTAQRRFRSTRALLSGAALFLAGCMGGQTGGELSPPERPPHVGTPAEDSACKEQPTAIALADASRLGFSGMDVLAATLGTHTAPLQWKPDMGPVSFGPERGASSISVTIEYRDGQTRFVSVAPTSDRSGAEPATGCRTNHLEIDVVVRVATAGGALNEEFATALIATAPDRAELAGRLRVSELVGSFFVDAPVGHVVGPLDINVYFDGAAFRGTLNGSVEQRVGDGPNGSVGVVFVPFASWP